jgi:hypothetical protein
MASTYVNDLRLNEMATGDASGSWGTVTNTNLELIGEAFSYGTETIGDADSTLTIADGAADAARSFYLKITSSVDLTTTRIVTLAPNTVSKVWMIENATTGSQVITIKQGSGATINVPNGQVKMISTDGAGSGGAVLDLLVDVDLTGTTTLVNLDVSGAVDIAGDLTLSAGGDGALRFTAASSVKVLDNNAAALVFEEADNAYMTFVTTDGSEAVKFDKALDINAATQIDATVTVGVDDTGYDVKLFGATAGAYMLWDESADDLILGGAAGLSVNSTALVTGVLTTTAATVSNGGGQFNGAINVGVDDTGYDVKLFGATAGAYMLWDESADDLILGGAAGLSVNSTALVTGVLTTTAATVSNGGGQFNGAINVGVDDTGYDVKFFGATTGKSLLWDESADSLTVAGNLSVDGGTIKLDGNYPVGTNNVALGDTALDSIASGGTRNTAVGFAAGTALTTQGYNVFVGSYSGDGATGSSNVAVGDVTLRNASGSFNTAIGGEALNSNTTASSNTAVGYQAGYTSTTAIGITAVGYKALRNNTGSRNSAFGGGDDTSYNAALGFNTTGTDSAAFGIGALAGNTTGSFNTASGVAALYNNTTASNNTAVGFQAGYLNTTGSLNVAVGSNALDANITGTANTAVGYNALSASTGDGATAVGKDALELNTSGINTAVGANALATVTSGTGNVGIGNDVLTVNTASNNTAVGYQAAYNNTEGDRIVAVGKGALYTNSTGAYSVAVGTNALNAADTAQFNTAVGDYAMQVTTGSSNTGIGAASLYNNSSGQYNTALGHSSLQSNTTADNNTAVGYSAGYASTGANNVFLGFASGNDITTGSNNSILGRFSGNQGGLDIRTSNNNIVLSDGDGNPRVIVDSSGNVLVGKTASSFGTAGTEIIAAGNINITKSAAVSLNVNRIGSSAGAIIVMHYNGADVGSIDVTASATSYNTSSDYRLKTDAQPMTGASARVQALKPVNFEWIATGDSCRWLPCT